MRVPTGSDSLRASGMNRCNSDTDGIVRMKEESMLRGIIPRGIFFRPPGGERYESEEQRERKKDYHYRDAVCCLFCCETGVQRYSCGIRVPVVRPERRHHRHCGIYDGTDGSGNRYADRFADRDVHAEQHRTDRPYHEHTEQLCLRVPRRAAVSETTQLKRSDRRTGMRRGAHDRRNAVMELADHPPVYAC